MSKKLDRVLFSPRSRCQHGIGGVDCGQSKSGRRWGTLERCKSHDALTKPGSDGISFSSKAFGARENPGEVLEEVR